MADIIRQDIIQVNFDIDDSPLRKAEKSLNSLQSNVKDVDKGSFSGFTQNAKKASESIKGLSTDTKNAHKGVKELAKTSLNNLAKGAKTVATNIGNVAKKAGTAVKDLAKTSFTKLTNGLKKVKTYLSDTNTAGGKAFSALKKIAGISFKGLAVGVGAAATAIGGVVTKAVSSFGEFEQFKGGMEKIFDKADQKAILEHAHNAYKDLGMTANQYLSAINNTGATFASTMGDQKGYDTARTGMKAISDYATGAGENIDELNEKFTLITRSTSSYQSIADQFSGILPTTAKDFLKQAQSAGFLKKSYSELTKVPIAEYQEAVAKMLEKGVKGLGLAENTYNEATKTLTGSMGMAKAAWGNLVTAIGSGENLDQACDNFISSAEVFGVQLIPVVERALGGIGVVVEKLTPKIAEKLPELAKKLLPSLIKSAWELTKGLVKALPSIVGTVATTIVDIFGEKFPIIKKIGDGLVGHADKIAYSILGIFGAIKGVQMLKPLLSMFGGGKGKKGGFLANIGGQFEKLGKSKSGLVAKGVANLSIIVGGVAALTAVVAGVGILISKVSNTKDMFVAVGIIGAVGLVGAGLAKLGGIVGKIPVSSVALGLANMALVIGGVSALIVAFGKLSEIKGFNDFITKGGATLANLFGQIGKIGGSLVGGLAEGVTDHLPKIGKNIADFATSLKPMFTMFNGVDMNGIGSFFKSMGSFMLQMASEGILSIFTGGTNFADLGTGLNTFAEKSSGFFKKVAELPENSFTNATKLFDCLAGMKSLPKEGGVVGWFNGGVNYETLSNGLKQLSNENVTGFFNAVTGLEQAGFDNATKLFDCLAGLKSLPKEGGVKGWFSGGVDYSKIASGLKELSGDGVKNFFTMVSGLSAKTFENTKALFDSFASIKKLPTDGGWWDKVKGEETTTLGNVAKELGNFGEKTATFFEQVNGLNVNKLNGLWKSLERAGELTTENLSGVIGESISTLVTKISELPQKMGDALKNNSKGLSDGFVSMWTDAVKASVAPVNKLLSGANHILKEFGSKKKVIEWTPYAGGTNGHRGGNALVNDGRGAELVQMPNGETFIPRGRNVFIPNAPKGMKVLPAENTARLMGKKSPTFKYADGIGDIDIWSFIDNPSGLANKIANSVSYEGMSGFAYNVGKGMVTTFTGAMSGWIEKLFKEEGALSLADYVASKGVSQWRSTVIRALKMEGLYSAANVERTLYQMQTESGGNPRAINLWDSNAKKGIPSKGLMQVIDPTFRAYARAGFDKNIYDPLSNILASVRYARARYGTLAKAFRGKGYENGGIATTPSIFGEGGAEMAIPLSVRKRSRAVGLWAQTGELLGLYNSEEKTANSSGKVEYNEYAPVINITVNGGSDARATARSVKKAVKEVLQDMAESLERRTPTLQEI